MSDLPSGDYPRIRPVADVGIMVEFSQSISEAANSAVLALDTALSAHPFPGFTETVPAYSSLFVGYDPLVTDPDAVRTHLTQLWANVQVSTPEGKIWEVPVCYDPPFSPDLASVAERVGRTAEEVIEAHLAGCYRVYMYGFAPGYAYLGGVPEPIQLPRKPAPVRDIPAGSLSIAGPQCLVSTMMMPTGWWVIGRSPARILRPEHDVPFLFQVGDRVVFRRIDMAEFEAAVEAAK